jgi:hypothetical protein
MLKINAQSFYDAAVEIKRGQVLLQDFRNRPLKTAGRAGYRGSRAPAPCR